MQHISENPNDFTSWFDAFTIIVRNNLDPNIIDEEIYLPAIDNQEERKAKFENLRDGISRFLESYQNNNGLNIISGLTRLFLNDYGDADGKQRFEKAMNTVQELFTDSNQELIFEEIVQIAKHLELENREELCISLIIFYPEKLEYLADVLGLEHLLYKEYQEKEMQLTQLNKELYEQLTRIQ